MTVTDGTVPETAVMPYTQCRSGVVFLGPEPHGLSCSCEACLFSRATLRGIELLDLKLAGKTMRDTSWAFREWDGPTANFPGAVSSDIAQVTRVRGMHRRSDG